jgi:hypothetical protein
MLAECASHAELRRQVLRALPPAPQSDVAGREVA